MPAVKTYDPGNKEDSGIGILDFGKRFIRSAYAPFQNVAADVLNPLLPGTPITYIPFGGGDSVTKKEFYNNKKADTGIATLTGMEGSPEMPAQKPKLAAEPDIELKPRPTKEDKAAAKKRIEGDKEEPKEDDRPKGLKDYMAKIFEDGDALIALGGAIARGEGLVGGLEEFSKTRKETEATEYARQVAKYERERQQELDVLQKASTLAEIAYKESQMTSDDQKMAMDLAIQTARSQGVTDINSEAFAKIYAEAIDTVVQKEKPITLTDIAENIGMSSIGANQGGGVAMNIPIVTMAGTPINQ